MADAPKKSRIWEYLLIFAIVYLLSTVVRGYLFPAPLPAEEQHLVTLEPQSASFRGGHEPVLTLTNRSLRTITFSDRCPRPPMDVFVREGTGGNLVPIVSDTTAVPCVALPGVEPGETAQLSLAPWKYSLFSSYRSYEVHVPIHASGTGALKTSESVQGKEGPELVARFSVHEPNVFVKVFRTFITEPFLNFLIFVASVLPNHNLGIAIIVLTLLVKLILYFPTQKSMEGQRKMQLIQPKVEELRKRFKDDPKKLHEETMKLWRTEKVNPFQSCLPILLQLPILIGLLYVVRDGSNLALSREFIYGFYQDLSWGFNTFFLGLDLTQPNWVFPPILVLLQFLQMKLSFAAAARKQTAPQDKAQKTQQMMMTYTLPFVIGFLAINFPGAVSLYWGVSTIFAIGQQVVTNRRVG